MPRRSIENTASPSASWSDVRSSAVGNRRVDALPAGVRAACRRARSSSLYSDVRVKSTSRSGSAIVGRQPDPVDRERFVARPIGGGRAARAGHRARRPSCSAASGLGDLRERPHLAALRYAALLDDLEQAVQRSERTLERPAVDRRADATGASQDAVGAELADGVAGGVAADAVDLHQFAIGREALLEVSRAPSAAGARHRAVPRAASGPARSSVSRAVGRSRHRGLPSLRASIQTR